MRFFFINLQLCHCTFCGFFCVLIVYKVIFNKHSECSMRQKFPLCEKSEGDRLIVFDRGVVLHVIIA